jgi:hypothetical protein
MAYSASVRSVATPCCSPDPRTTLSRLEVNSYPSHDGDLLADDWCLVGEALALLSGPVAIPSACSGAELCQRPLPFAVGAGGRLVGGTERHDLDALGLHDRTGLARSVQKNAERTGKRNAAVRIVSEGGGGRCLHPGQDERSLFIRRCRRVADRHRREVGASAPGNTSSRTLCRSVFISYVPPSHCGGEGSLHRLLRKRQGRLARQL